MQNKSKSTCLGRFKFELECEYEIESIKIFWWVEQQVYFFAKTIIGFEVNMALNCLASNNEMCGLMRRTSYQKIKNVCRQNNPQSLKSTFK